MACMEAEHCKTVGSAYVGSNPTPATTSQNGPLAAETRPGGPLSSCHAMYQRASLWVDAWQCARTYGVQRPGKTSGARNRSLCYLVAVGRRKTRSAGGKVGNLWPTGAVPVSDRSCLRGAPMYFPYTFHLPRWTCGVPEFGHRS